jgi:hypothetical protein
LSAIGIDRFNKLTEINSLLKVTFEWEYRLMSNALKALILIASLSFAENAAATNLITNGSFETPVLGAPAFNIPVGSPLITGWNVVQGNVDLTNTCCTAAFDGVQAVDLIGDDTATKGVFGGLSQTFATTANQQYTLTFAYSHNLGGSASVYAAQVTVADANDPANSVLSDPVTHLSSQTGYSIFSQTFTANSNSTILTFIDTQGAFNAGIYLDDVDVELVTPGVPEPSTWAMMILGFAGIGAMTYRRRKQTLHVA